MVCLLLEAICPGTTSRLGASLGWKRQCAVSGMRHDAREHTDRHQAVECRLPFRRPAGN